MKLSRQHLVALIISGLLTLILSPVEANPRVEFPIQGTPRTGIEALPITYHGGAVLSNSPFIYIILYGNFSGSTTPQILQDLISHQANLPYLLSIQKTYY